MVNPKNLTRRNFLARTAVLSATAWAVPPIVVGAEPSKKGQGTSTKKSPPSAELVGRFVYDGPAPPRKKLKVDKDIACCGKFDIRDESLLVDRKGGLANVYIYVRGRRVEILPQAVDAVGKEVLLDNRDCIFKPHCMKIWVARQKLKIVNSDPVAQNVAFSPLGDAPANIVMPPPPNKAATAYWKFKRPQRQPVPIACNYHPWESAFILPLAHPYCAISAASGKFSIRHLPPGPIEFQLWHERTGYLNTPKYRRGRVALTLAPGRNDLGTIRLASALFKMEV